jgi:hypothetical protein
MSPLLYQLSYTATMLHCLIIFERYDCSRRSLAHSSRNLFMTGVVPPDWDDSYTILKSTP